MSADWRATRLAPSRSHHLVDDRPLYADRFDRVEKYHAPGLAPVCRGDQAWHIDVAGEPAYAARYVQTFGYYEHLAAVDTGAGWVHVDTSGVPIGDDRHAWCGNFQGGRAPVRERGEAYVHIGPDGRPAYASRWRYAGDYRDGIAVVQRGDGLHTHIDVNGELVHGRWFLDLDVFHKGHARARDRHGWMHVDERGRAIYPARFASVEPFYNRQARVEGMGGELLVIDERGQTVVELRPSRRSEFEALSSDLVGYWRTHAIAAAVELGVFEALPASPAQLGERSRLPPAQAERLLRALAELRLIARTSAGEWQASSRGSLLHRDHPLSLAEAAREYATTLAQPWIGLSAALRHASPGVVDRFFQVAADPEHVRRHHTMLRSYARHDYPELADAIVQLGLSANHCVVDAGGGLGVLAGLLSERVAGLRPIVLERPEVVAALSSTDVDARVADLFEPWPLAAVDWAVFARVLHDHDDERARGLLGHARDALAPGGRVIIVEQILCEDDGGLVDLHVLVVHGGRERDEAQWRALLDSAGLELMRVITSARVPSLLEARPR